MSCLQKEETQDSLNGPLFKEKKKKEKKKKLSKRIGQMVYYP